MSSNYQVYLGLGSNLNNPHRQITTAINHISRLANTRIIKTAPLYQTKAWGMTNQADFINTVIAIQTALKPLALLKKIKHIEYRLMARQKTQRWHSRCIDIDILYYVQHAMQRPQLQLPHPYMQQRCFVLRPLLATNPTQLPLVVRRSMTLKKSCCGPLRPQRNPLENNKIQQMSG